MTRIPHFERTPPDHVVRGLRSLDPDAELVYVGYGKWFLGRIISDSRLYESGVKLKKSTLRAIATRNSGKPGKVLHQDILRLRIAELRMAGFQFTAEYNMKGTPDSAIVIDQRRMDWMYRTLTDDETIEAFGADAAKARADAYADLTDDARGRDAWRYLFTTNHYLGKTSSNAVRSGRVRHMTIH
jgi:hypothetical protein